MEVAALSTVAKWAGSAIISKLVGTAYSYLGKRMLPADTESQLDRLKVAIPQITAVMGVAEELKLKHPNSGVNDWLQQFKEAFLAAEDVLDELKYRELEDMVKNRPQVSGYSSSIVKKKFLSLKKKLKFLSLKKKFSGSAISEDTLKRLRGAVKKLDQVAAGVGPFFQFATALDVHGLGKPNNQPVYTSSPETTSELESKVFGRENEKATIIEWLKKPTSHGNISAFGIVGPGGLGKTTLAKVIFAEVNRENHFEKVIWVCVSTSFSVEDITRKILEGLGEETRNGETLNGLKKRLNERILSKKVFLILDDVWNDDKICEWEKLIAPLKSVQQGSKILLTTRMKAVADMLAGVLTLESQNLVLEGLEEKKLLELLHEYAFSGYNPDNHKDLQKLGNDIVKKLRGSPLAAKVIGSLLNWYMRTEQFDHARSGSVFHFWKRILNHDSLINLEEAKDVADVLKLSYYHLPAHLQECFRFCCIFPQDYVFDKDELIKMWMTSGFIRQELQGDESLEDIGVLYFNHLFSKSFFEKQYSWKEEYVMHDLMHDLAQNVSIGECCRVEPNGKSNNIPETVQHVSVHESEIERIFNLRNLRTLVITLSEDDINRDRFVPPNGSLKETLRLLVIQGKGRCELPEEIGSLLHLRFLKVNPYLRQSYRYLLPNSIYKLYHLQVLEMLTDGNSDYEGVETTGMTNLVNLRYMKLPDQVMQTIHGVHKLTFLQELNFFVGRESGRHIDELGVLNNLRSLSIENIENVGDPVEATNANLSKKEKLISLSLKWTGGSNSDDPEQVFDHLCPHPNLKELTIDYYTGHRSPIWMRDSSHLDLSSLTLSYCDHWEALPFLGQIPHLKELSLEYMSEVKEVDYSCDSTSDWAFPSLERLYCAYMPKLESWKGQNNCYGFPNLKELDIRECPNLTKLPNLPFSLKRFIIDNVAVSDLPGYFQSSHSSGPTSSSLTASLSDVWIYNCSNLTSLNGFLQQENIDLQGLEELKIEGCENLVQLPTGAFGKFVSLKHLVIVGSPKLATVDNQSILLPVKLEFLVMGNCGEHDVPLLESASQLSTLKELSIKNNANITCIPSSENAFTSLTNLNIYGCDKLIELSSMQQAHTVNPGNHLFSLKISRLHIVNLCLLLIEPLRSLRFVSHLTIKKCSGMEALPEQWLLQNSSTLKRLYIYDASSLRSLPGTMVRLTALEGLIIDKATLLEDIPELPTSLTVKSIYRG